jgi:CPA1 family monovalent cation:H+ antiporter
MVPLTFLVIIGTVVLQSATARPLARWLGVAEPEARGFLVIGANPVARLIAGALHEHGIHVVLTDSYWDNIRTARMAGLRTFYGNPVSEYADRHLELVGIGSLLAMSPQDDVNALASLRYRPEFGANAVYSLAPSTGKGNGGKHVTAIGQFGRLLFGEDITFSKLASLISQGAEIRSTTLSEDFDYETFLKERAGKAIQLFAITAKGQVRVFTTASELKPGPGWKLITLATSESPVPAGRTLLSDRQLAWTDRSGV